jgi:hypothetical protein
MTPRHGTYARYNGLKCRCRECRAANATYHRDYVHRHPEQMNTVARRTYGRATEVAKAALAKKHPREYRRLLDAALKAERS